MCLELQVILICYSVGNNKTERENERHCLLSAESVFARTIPMILSEMKAFPKLDIYYMYSIGQGKRLSLAEKLDYSHVRESLYRWLLELHKIIWSVWKGRFPVSTWRA
jgi:hypothetical protein